jgi:FAD/FMN-containing dehydrogenase
VVTLPRAATLELAGWGRTPVESCQVYRPERESELASIVAAAPTASVISRGMGRSYGDAASNAGRGVILHERFDRFLAFDEQAAVVHCEAAVTLSDLIDVLLPRGFFLPVTPGTRQISVGGAIAADVHGKNHHRDGTISGQLLDFRLLCADGRVRTCSREQYGDLFWATLGGMGLTGAILDARLRVRRVETAFLRQQTLRCRDLDDALARMLGEDAGYEYAVAWIDCLARGRSLGRSVLLRANPAGRDDLPERMRSAPFRIDGPLPLTVPVELPGFVLNSLSMRVFNQGFWAVHPDREGLAGYQSYFYPLDSVRHWNRVYGRGGVLQYQLVLPRGSCRDGLVEILERVTRSGRASFLAVLKSTGPANAAPLSFPIEGASLALDFPARSPELRGLLDELDRIVLAHGGRVYLAKDARLSPGAFREMYPQLERFREIKAKYDPDSRFASSLARRLGIVEER